MILHCTRKLAARLPEVMPAASDPPGPLGPWHGHVYTLDRRQCVLFCHDASRYTLFIAGLRKPDFDGLGRCHAQLFLRTLAAHGVAEARLKRVRLALGPLRCDQTTDRSVLASMRAAMEIVEHRVWEVANVLDLDPLRVSLELNARMASVRGRSVRPLERMLEQVQAL